MPEEKKNKLNQYVDTTGELSSNRLVFGTWYVEHKVLLQEIGMGILIAWCVIFGGFSLWKWGEYLFFGYWDDQATLANYTQNNQNYSSIQTAYKAQNLNISDVRVFPTSGDMYDFSASVQNPNQRWVANVSYHFEYSGESSEIQTASIMPLTKRPVVSFGVEATSFPASVNFVVDDIQWKSIDAHKIPNVENYLAERDLFSIDNFIVTPPSLTGVSFPTVSLDLFNQSAFSYSEPVFLVELLNGNQVVGFINLYFDKLAAFSSESAELRYFNSTAEINNIRVIPTMNYFDDNIYIHPGDI